MLFLLSLNGRMVLNPFGVRFILTFFFFFTNSGKVYLYKCVVIPCALNVGVLFRKGGVTKVLIRARVTFETKPV